MNGNPFLWKIIYTKQAQKDAKKLSASYLKSKTEELLNIIKIDPWKNPPPYEKLGGDLDGSYSRRINQQHRLVYNVLKSEQTLHILRMWTHYE